MATCGECSCEDVERITHIAVCALASADFFFGFDRSQDAADAMRTLNNDNFDKYSSLTAPICPPGYYASFERIGGAFRMGLPTIVSSLNEFECAETCRLNKEPVSGARRVCQGSTGGECDESD